MLNYQEGDPEIGEGDLATQITLKVIGIFRFCIVHHSQPHCSGQVCKNLERNILTTIAFPCKPRVLYRVT
jgi:hypothetical protein